MRTLLAGSVAVATAFIVVLGFGFWLHARTAAIPDGLFGWIAGIAIPIVAGAMYCLLLGMKPWEQWPRRTAQRTHAPPVHRVLGASAEQIAYRENPNVTASCVHLQPIERAMRVAGVNVRLLEAAAYRPSVEAKCRINEAELGRVFALPESILYKEWFEPERSEWDNPRADIVCAECLAADRSRAGIMVLHPRECRGDEPWFPSAP